MKIIIAAFLFCLSASAQAVLDTDTLNNPNNVFLYSLKEYCKSLDSTVTKTVYLKWDNIDADIWPLEVNGHKIKYLRTQKDYKKAIKENGGNTTIISIGSLEFRDGKFYVGIVPFSATYKKRVVHLANGGGIIYYFDYDAECKGLIYNGSEYWGI